MLDTGIYRALLDGARITILVSVLAVAWGTVAAIALGVAARSRLAPLRWVVRTYVELVRGVSAIILLFWIFYALPLVGVKLTPLQAGVLALGLNLSAYGAEIVRGALAAVPAGQTEAAIAINLSGPRRLWSVILPQAVVTMLPPYGNLVIEVMKASALVSLVTLRDLTFQAQNLRQLRVASTAEIFAVALLLYFLIAYGITGIFRLLERRFGRGLTTGRASRQLTNEAGVGTP